MLNDAAQEMRRRITQDDADFVLTLSAPEYRRDHQTEPAQACLKSLQTVIEIPEAPRKLSLHSLNNNAEAGLNRVTLECFTQKQHFTTHIDLQADHVLEGVLDLLFGLPFLQAHMQTAAGDITLHLYPRPNDQAPKVVLKRGKASRKQWGNQSENDKQHPITVENAKDLLQTLGIADDRGRIIDSRRSKFRQINQFISLAMTLDMFKSPSDSKLSVVDCGCGKAYLSLALYWYLNKIRGLEVELLGIDFNPRVINFANAAAQQLGMQAARFVHSTITDAATPESCDLLIALHACDTATDEALALALKVEAKAILAAPCCHHYVNERLRRDGAPDEVGALLQDNISRERLADLLTDSMRRDILQAKGYRASLIEFVAPEHTSKNIMIRAEYIGKTRDITELDANYERWGVAPFLTELIKS